MIVSDTHSIDHVSAKFNPIEIFFAAGTTFFYFTSRSRYAIDFAIDVPDANPYSSATMFR
jgi:hypothetical protein